MDYKTDVLAKMNRFEEQKRTVNIQISRIPDEGYCANPKYTSIHQKIDEEKRNARTKVGLTEETEHPKDVAKEISLNWVHKPEINCTSKLHEKRATQNLNDLRALEGNVGRMLNAEQRLN